MLRVVSFLVLGSGREVGGRLSGAGLPDGVGSFGA